MPEGRRTAALAAAAGWAALVFALVSLALEWKLAGVASRQGAMVQWLLVGVLPAALALWGLPPPEAPRARAPRWVR